MNATKFSIATLALLIVAASGSAQGRRPLSHQEKSDYLVSAKAGIVNAVEGTVTFKRGETPPDTLLEGDELQSGDVIETQAGSRVEVLLNPGSYLRLSENSAFVFTNTSVDDIKLHLTNGSAILEASIVNQLISVTTAQARYSVLFGGLYRFNVSPNAKDEVIVRKGEVKVGAAITANDGRGPLKGATIPDGKRALVGPDKPGGDPVIAKLDKRSDDSLDKWSKNRAKTIVASNRKIHRDVLRGGVVSLLGAGMRSPGGFWIFNPYTGGYTFVPSGFWDLWSPYGYCYINYAVPGYYGSGIRSCCYGGGGYSGSRPGGGGGGGGTVGPGPAGGGGGGGSTGGGGVGRGGEGAAPSSPRGGGSRPPQ